MGKVSVAICLLVAAVGIYAGPMGTARVPLALKNTSKYFWHPTENGGFVPAMLEGGRKLTKADESDVHFSIYTSANRNGYELVIGDDTNFDNSPYISGAPLKIISHGFSSSGSGGPGPQLRDAYFRAGKNVNVIIIDWSAIAAAPWYDTAAAGTKIVGEKTGRLILFLLARRVVTLDQIHFMGHSLGSHVAGWCGSFLGAGQLGRITALDPALPLFGEKPDSDRIDPSDAAFVDVIHTAGGSILNGGLAFTDPRGHADFYPNGGIPHQPGCGTDAFGTCSHGRCYEFMEESITNSNAFNACLCNSWEEFNLGSCPCNTRAVMGESTPRTGAKGRFYLATNAGKPYSQS